MTDDDRSYDRLLQVALQVVGRPDAEYDRYDRLCRVLFSLYMYMGGVGGCFIFPQLKTIVEPVIPAIWAL